MVKMIIDRNGGNMEKETLKQKIDSQIGKLKEMIASGNSFEEVKKEERILNELLKQFLEESK